MDLGYLVASGESTVLVNLGDGGNIATLGFNFASDLVERARKSIFLPDEILFNLLRGVIFSQDKVDRSIINGKDFVK
jgi:hypothetical protein